MHRRGAAGRRGRSRRGQPCLGPRRQFGEAAECRLHLLLLLVARRGQRQRRRARRLPLYGSASCCSSGSAAAACAPASPPPAPPPASAPASAPASVARSSPMSGKGAERELLLDGTRAGARLVDEEHRLCHRHFGSPAHVWASSATRSPIIEASSAADAHRGALDLWHRISRRVQVCGDGGGGGGGGGGFQHQRSS